MAGAAEAVIRDSKPSPAAARAQDIECTLVIPTPTPANVTRTVKVHIEPLPNVIEMPKMLTAVIAKPLAQTIRVHLSFHPAVPSEPTVHAIENTVRT